MTNLGTFRGTFYGETHDFAVIEQGNYIDGTAAIEVYTENGEPWTKLTVCIPGTELAKDERLIKTWGENAAMCAKLLEVGMFEDTGKRVPTGHVEASIWKAVKS